MSRSHFVWRSLAGGCLAWTMFASSSSVADQPPGSGKAPAANTETEAGDAGHVDQGAPPYIDPVLLDLGRSIYGNLQRARQAVLDKRSTLLKVAIEEARSDLTLLRLPPEQMALADQLRLIRHDLRDTSKSVDTDLWVPLQIEVNEALAYTSDERWGKARAALAAGMQAAAQDERETAASKLDTVVSVVRYSAGLFPLHKLKDVLDAASSAAHRDEPDWQAALAALQSAMASIHWYTQAPLQGLTSAYNEVIDAYAVMLNAAITADQRQQAIDSLTRAASRLDASMETKPLADEVRALLGKARFQADDLRTLLGDLQSQIDSQQNRAQNLYWEMVGRGEIP